MVFIHDYIALYVFLLFVLLKNHSPILLLSLHWRQAGGCPNLQFFHSVYNTMGRQRYFTPNEVSLHNTADDLWVSFLGKVYDLTPLCEKYKGKNASFVFVACESVVMMCTCIATTGVSATLFMFAKIRDFSTQKWIFRKIYTCMYTYLLKAPS